MKIWIETVKLWVVLIGVIGTIFQLHTDRRIIYDITGSVFNTVSVSSFTWLITLGGPL